MGVDLGPTSLRTGAYTTMLCCASELKCHEVGVSDYRNESQLHGHSRSGVRTLSDFIAKLRRYV